MRDDSLDGSQPRPGFVSLDDSGQAREGMYMIGQVAALRDKTCSIEELHQDVSAGGVKLLEEFAGPLQVNVQRKSGPSDIAIIGMSCLLPKSADKGRFWENILNGVRATGEVPAERANSLLNLDTATAPSAALGEEPHLRTGRPRSKVGAADMPGDPTVVDGRVLNVRRCAPLRSGRSRKPGATSATSPRPSNPPRSPGGGHADCSPIRVAVGRVAINEDRWLVAGLPEPA